VSQADAVSQAVLGLTSRARDAVTVMRHPVQLARVSTQPGRSTRLEPKVQPAQAVRPNASRPPGAQCRRRCYREPRRRWAPVAAPMAGPAT